MLGILDKNFDFGEIHFSVEYAIIDACRFSQKTGFGFSVEALNKIRLLPTIVCLHLPGFYALGIYFVRDADMAISCFANLPGVAAVAGG
ncbi:hypothetical protein LP7551_01905 [Roseibium album]|nr:hypothetical protein LP7551_01905 [Roseibium album]